MLDISLPSTPVGEFGDDTVSFGVSVSENLCATQPVFRLFGSTGGEPA